MARRIEVMGPSCAGKTTLATELARRYGLPHIELDALFHGPNWTEPPIDEFRANVEAALAAHDGWIVDGNYMGKLGRWLIDQADTLVWLDFPLRVTLPRMFRRTARRVRGNVELWNGNRESWRNFMLAPNGLLWFSLRHYRRRRREWTKRFEGRNVVRLRSPRQLKQWLETLPAAPE